MKLKKLLTIALLGVGGMINGAWAQTDVTSTYITNPGFEEEYTIQKTYQAGGNKERYIFKPNGWIVTQSGANENDLTCLTTSDKQANSFSSYTMAHSGSQTYWVRLRWGGWTWTSNGPTGNQTSVTLSQSFTLPNGVYRLSADLLCYAGGTEANNHTYMKAANSNNIWTVEPTINHTKSDENWENKSMLITSSGSTEYTVYLQCLQAWTGTELLSGFDDVKLEKYNVNKDNTLDITSIVPKGTGNWTNNGANNAGTFSNGGVDMVERYYNQHYTGTVSELVVKDLPLGLYDAEVYCHAHCADWNCSAIAEAAGQTDRTILSANTVEVGIPIVNDKSLTEGPQVRTLNNISVTDGTLTFRVRNDQEGANWLTFEIKSLTYKGVDITLVKSTYNNAKAAAEAARDDAAYATIVGAERTALLTAISAPVEETEDSYIAATNNLTSATEAFNATTVNNYALLATEKTKASNLGMSSSEIAAATPNTKTGLKALQDLKVAEFNYVSTNYSYGVALGEWISEAHGTKAANFNNQHWSGETRNYKNQDDNNGQGWNANSWDINFSQDVTLPAGNYVFKVAGRQASGDQVTTSLVVKQGDTTLGTVSDFPRSNSTRGINKSGATAFDGDNSEFANNGSGYGWEWRYVKFTLASNATVNIAINSVATAKYQWVSFGDYTLQTDNEANISLIAYNIALNNAQTIYGNSDYSAVVGIEKTTLKAAIDADDNLDKTDKDAIDAATTTLNEAAEAFTAAKASYEALATASTFFNDEDYTQVLYPYASDEKFAAIATAKAMSASSASECSAKATAIYAAYRGFVESNALAEKIATAVECTNFIENANAQQSDENAIVSGQAFGWTKGTGMGRKNNEPLTAADGTNGGNYFDFWSGSAWEKTITQTITIPAGRYILTVTSRASSNLDKFNLIVGEETPVAMKKINADVNTGTFGRGWNDNYIVFDHTGGPVTIGIDAAGNNNWMSFDRFRLTCIEAAATMVIKDAKWATFVAPFDVTIPSGVTAYTVDAVNGSMLTMPEITGTTIDANTPVVLFSEETVNQTLNGKFVAGTPEEGALTGTYADIDAPDGKYILQDQRDTGGKVGFYQVDTNAATPKVRANRAYLTAPANPNPVKAFYFGDIETAIKSVMDGVAAGEVYDPSGRKISKLQRGVNIVNGKKVMVK